MIKLQAQQVARIFGDEILFHNVQLTIQDQSRIALIGPNGIGKSTLLKILAGLEPPDEGSVILGKQVSVGYLAQDSGLDTQQTIYAEMRTVFADLIQKEAYLHDLEAQLADPNLDTKADTYPELLARYDNTLNEFTEQNGYGFDAEIRSILHGFSFYEADFDKPISTLSGGERSRLAMAKLLLEKKDILILDEPTNHLDMDTLAWLEGYLANYAGALLIVSHDRYFLDKVANEVYELNQHEITHYTGNYTKYLKVKAANQEAALKAYEKQQAEIAKLEDYVAKNLVRASTTKMAQSRQKKLDKMVRLEKPVSQEKKVHFHFTAAKESGREVLNVTDAAIGYTPTEIMAEPINLEVKKHDLVAIVGPNGIGKSTLLKSILGKIPFIKGQARLGSQVEVGYYDQEQGTLHPKKTVLAELWDEHSTTPEKEIRTLLGSFLFTGEDVERYVSQLSGGQKARLALTKLAMDQENFLILDEPTNHLDINSREVLEAALKSFTGTVLFVSHDRYFINQLATKVLEIAPTGSQLYLGDFDYYVEKKAELEAITELEHPTAPAETISTQVNAPTKDFKQTKEAQRELRKVNRELEAVEGKMDTVNETIDAIQVKMTNPELFADHLALQELQQDLAKEQATLSELETKWEDLAAKAEEFES